jgi:hypothetical protein
MPSRLVGIVQITVVEGSKSQIFYIARNLLDSKAPGFMSAFDPTEHDERTAVKLTDVQIKVFDYFVQWLEGHRVLNSLWEPLCRIYVFGNIYGIQTLRNSVINVILEMKREIKDRSFFGYNFLSQWTPWHLVEYVYDNTPVQSQLRHILVDLFCMSTSIQKSPDSPLSSIFLDRYPKSFLVDVMLQKLDAAPNGQHSAQTAGTSVDRQQTELEPAKKKRKAKE